MVHVDSWYQGGGFIQLLTTLQLHWILQFSRFHEFSKENFDHPIHFSMTSSQQLIVIPLELDFYEMILISTSLWTLQRLNPSWDFTYKLKLRKGSLLALLTKNLQMTSRYLRLQPFALLATMVLQPSPWLIRYKASTSLCTPCMALCFTCTLAIMRTTISLLSFLR